MPEVFAQTTLLSYLSEILKTLSVNTIFKVNIWAINDRNFQTPPPAPACSLTHSLECVNNVS